MSLLPESASFEERVQDCFLVFRGSGLMLSPLDHEVLAEWAALEIPFEVVARGIRKAAEKALWDARPGEPSLKSLRSCKRYVQSEIRKYLDRAAGRRKAESNEVRQSKNTRTLEEERQHRLGKMLRTLAQEQPRMEKAVYSLLEGELRQVRSDFSDTEARVEATLLRALPFSERLPLLKEAATRTREANCTSQQARKVSGRFHRGAVLRRALSLPSFW